MHELRFNRGDQEDVYAESRAAIRIDGELTEMEGIVSSFHNFHAKNRRVNVGEIGNCCIRKISLNVACETKINNK